jgi:hypothetical protein
MWRIAGPDSNLDLRKTVGFPLSALSSCSLSFIILCGIENSDRQMLPLKSNVESPSTSSGEAEAAVIEGTKHKN